MVGKRSSIPLLLVMAALMIPAPSGSGAYSGLSNADPAGDVTSHIYQERTVSGFGEIDIISLETRDRVARLDAVVTFGGNVMGTTGYLYSMNIGGVAIFHDNGVTEVFRISDGQELDDVIVEVSGRTIEAGIPKIRLEDTGMNATAQFLVRDPGSGEISENYYDSISGEAGQAVSQYQVSLSDPSGDAVSSYLVESPLEADHLDILRLSAVEEGGRITLSMTLSGEARTGPGINYTFGIGDDRFRMIGLNIEMDAEDATMGEFEVRGKVISLVVYRQPLLPGEIVMGEVSEGLPDGGWADDRCPDTPPVQVDLFPVGTGSEMQVELHLGDDGISYLYLNTTDIEASTVQGLANTLDADSSGQISESEYAVYTDPLEDLLARKPPLELDGETARVVSLSVTLNLEGRDRGIFIEMVLETTFEEGGSVDVELPPLREIAEPDQDREIRSRLDISLPVGWSMDPFSLDPSGLGNHILPESRGVKMDSEEPMSFNLISTGITFTMIGQTDGEDGNREEDVQYEDVPGWVYFIGILVLIAIAVMVYRLGSGKEPPQQDY